MSTISSMLTGTVELPSAQRTRAGAPALPPQKRAPSKSGTHTTTALGTPVNEIGADEPSKAFVGGFIRIGGLSDLSDKPETEPGLLARLAEREIRRNMGKKDSLEIDSEGAFVLRFGTDDIEAARQTSKSIVSEIKTAIHRQDPSALKQLDIDNFVQAIPEGGDPGNTAALLELLAISAPTKAERDRTEELVALRRAKATFEPFWHPGSSGLGLNRLCLELPANLKKRYAALEEGETKVVALAAVDIETVERCVAALRREGSSKHRSTIIVPVSYATLVNMTAARRYVESLSGIAEDTRNHMVVEVVGMPAGDQSARDLLRTGLVDLLARIGIQIVIRMTGLEFAHVYPLVDRIRGITVLLGKQDDESQGGERDLVRNCAYASATGLEMMVSRAVTVGQAMTAINAGCAWIAGPSVHMATDLPKGRQAFNAVLFKASLKRS